MRSRDEEHLIELLQKLMEAQDNVTHTNEKGKEFAEATIFLIKERNHIYEDILSFVKSIVDP